MLARASLALLIPLAACGGGSSTPIDAAGQSDAGPPSVRAVACPPGIVPTVTTTGTTTPMYSPMSAMVSVGGIVKFIMPADHNVAPNSMRNTDSGLRVDFGATACLEFDKAGSFGFLCTSHSFTGTITVQ